MRLRAVSLLLLLSAACAPATGPTDLTEETPPPVSSEGPSVVAVVAPTADLVQQVLGTRGEVRSLIPQGTDSHTYEPRPADAVMLAEAEAYIGIGLGLNDAARSLAEANLPEGAPLVLLAEEVVAPQDLIQEPTEFHTHSGRAHAHTYEEPNPHVWMSLPLTIRMVERISEVLAELHPEAAEEYRSNARSYNDRLERFHGSVSAAMATIPEEDRKLVTYHDAASYIARDYDLELVRVVQPSHFAEPSAAEVRAVIDVIRAEGVPAVFGSEVFGNDVLAVIAEETGATYYGDLSDDVLPGEQGDPEHSYLGMMDRNLRTIVSALGGYESLIPSLR